METHHAHRRPGILGCIVIVLSLLEAIWTMAATASAAISALQEVCGGEDHVWAIPVVVSAFDELGRCGHAT
jgi:hypothetical protein